MARCLHTCDVCIPVQLIEFLSDQNELAAADVLVFVREATQRFEQLRPVIIGKLLDTFPSIKSLKYGIFLTIHSTWHFQGNHNLKLQLFCVTELSAASIVVEMKWMILL